jgi:hypothetical protein
MKYVVTWPAIGGRREVGTREEPRARILQNRAEEARIERESCRVVWLNKPISDEDHERGITLTGKLAGHHWSTDRIIDLLVRGGKIREAMEQELRLRGAKLDEGTLPFDIEKT